MDDNVTDLARMACARRSDRQDHHANGKTTTLLIGDDTPTGIDVYAKLDGDPRLFTMSKSIKDSFDKTPRICATSG